MRESPPAAHLMEAGVAHPPAVLPCSIAVGGAAFGQVYDQPIMVDELPDGSLKNFLRHVEPNHLFVFQPPGPVDLAQQNGSTVA